MADFMTGAASLLDTMELSCCACHRRGPDTFRDLPGLEAFLSGPQIPHAAGRVPPALVPIRTITADSVARFGPVHRACLEPPPRRPAAARPPYDLSRSVA